MIIILGFIMLGMGVVLLSDSGQGVFFVFPFFFFGDAGFVPFAIIFSLMVLLLFFWWANYQYPEDARFKRYQSPRQEFLKVGSQCQFCGSPMPENASFCSSCGNQVEYGFSDNDSF